MGAKELAGKIYVICQSQGVFVVSGRSAKGMKLVVQQSQSQRIYPADIASNQIPLVF